MLIIGLLSVALMMLTQETSLGHDKLADLHDRVFQLIDSQDESKLGRFTPDPLRYAFSPKSRPHVGGMSVPLSGDAGQNVLFSVLNSSTVSSAPRCLYIHIPFCRVRCTYCNFFQYAASRERIDAYFSSLLLEIRLKAVSLWAQSAPFDAVYVGGGTPTDLSSSQIQQLGEVLRRSFPLKADCEITLEGRINRFGDDKFEAALAGGFNRFSFGIQSFNTQVRRAAKRLDDGDAALLRIQQLSKQQEAVIVIDLLYGLPHQTHDVWLDDLQAYQESGAHGVDLYQLLHLQGLPMQTLIEKGRLPEPANSHERAGMFAAGVTAMNACNDYRLSNNHWARTTKERSLYNSLAKGHAEILPLGAGGGGNVGGIQWMQHRDIKHYQDDVLKQRIPTGMMSRQPSHVKAFGLLKSGFDRGVFSALALDGHDGEGITRFDALLPLFNEWQRRDLVNVDENSMTVTLTLAGQFWAVTLAQIVLDVLQPSMEMPKVA